MLNAVLEHVPIKLESLNADDYSNDSSIWRASTSTEAAVAASASTTGSVSSSAANLEVNNEIESCGNVFIFNRRKLFLICGFCDSKYANMLQFAKHLNDSHRIFSKRYEESSSQGENAASGTDESDSDETTLSAVSELIVKGGFQIRFVREGSTEDEKTSLPTPTDTLLRHVPIKVEEPEDVLKDEEKSKATEDFENNIESCGNIFVMNRRKLFLICGFCEGKYANMELFGAHLHQSHTIFKEDEEPQSVAINVKEEPQEVLVPIKRRSTVNENAPPMVAIPTGVNVDNQDIIPPEEVPRPTTSAKRILRDKNSTRASYKDIDCISETSETSEVNEEEPLNVKEYFTCSSGGTLSCLKCPKKFTKMCRMTEHIRLHTGEKPFKCRECGKCFRIKLRMTEHQMRHREVKAYTCQICGLGCATRQDFALHQRHHNGDKRFSCKECGKAFVRSGDLKIHLRIHSGEKPFKCEICHTTFRANQNLIVHRRLHDSHKQFKCDFCEKRFRRNIDRKVHHRTHTGEKAFKCEICNRGYSARVHVRRHIAKRHLSDTSAESKSKKPPKNKTFQCSLCPRLYSGKLTLEKHVKKMHTDTESVPSPPVSDTSALATEVTVDC